MTEEFAFSSSSLWEKVRVLSSDDDDFLIIDDGGHSTTTTAYDDSHVLRDTTFVYGTALIVLVLVFCLARRAFPKVYNLRKWLEEHPFEGQQQPNTNRTVNNGSPLSSSSAAATATTPLLSSTDEDCNEAASPLEERREQPDEESASAADGFFSWIREVYSATDHEILQKCGLDALCLIRITQMGYKLSLLGMFNSTWLILVYATASKKNDTKEINDLAVEITIANLPLGAWQRFVASIVASYIFFIYAMYLVLQDFAWYTKMRHNFLKLKQPRNYSVFIRNIPRFYQNNLALEQFMRSCFSSDTAVLEAHVAVTTSQLAKVEADRDAMLAKLEHALAVYEATGRRPTHREKLCGQVLDSIETFERQLNELNNQVEQGILSIEEKIRASQSSASEWGAVRNMVRSGLAGNASLREAASTTAANHSSRHAEGNGVGDAFSAMRTMATDAVGDALQTATGHVENIASGAAALITGVEDGEAHSAGFVVFTKLATTNAALQMVHHPTPFSMEITEAPDPSDIMWSNISRTHQSLQIGKLLSLALTVGLCLLWTIPMSFIATMSSVEGLRKASGFVDEILDDAPFLVPLLEVTAPFFVVVANSMLPMLLRIITLFEGPISGAVVKASLFTKLAAFMIIQTFFVSAISGSLISRLEEMIEKPKLIIDLLSKTLPSQSTYFIQISVVSTIVNGGMELLRVVPVGMAIMRSFIAPSLTEKERRATYFGLQSLCNPFDFQHPDFTSQVVFYFMVLLVYNVISPLTTLVIAFCFLFLQTLVRYQFLKVYPKKPDSGGKLWYNFIQLFVSCMLVAQVTMLGLLGLKKAKVASPLFLPLLICTALFSVYIRQQHFRVSEFLPTRNCLREDVRRSDLDLAFLRGSYLQPELKAPRRVSPGQTHGAPTSGHFDDYDALN